MRRGKRSGSASTQASGAILRGSTARPLPPELPEHANTVQGPHDRACLCCFPTQSTACSPQLLHCAQVTAPVHALRDRGAVAAAAAAGRPGGAAVHHAGAVPPRGAVLARRQGALPCCPDRLSLLAHSAEWCAKYQCEFTTNKQLVRIRRRGQISPSAACLPSLAQG